MTGRLAVLTGPSGVGKGTVVAELMRHTDRIWLSVSATTRAPRPGEVEGRSYFFVDDTEFDRLVATGGLLEWAAVHGRTRYGTPREPVEKALAKGRVVLLEVDLSGARQVRASAPQAETFFLAPPSWDELVRRLVGRGTEPEHVQERRLETARVELAAQSEFDHVVVNDDVDQTVAILIHLLDLGALDGVPGDSTS